jgi:hypothetical protein
LAIICVCGHPQSGTQSARAVFLAKLAGGIHLGAEDVGIADPQHLAARLVD